MIKYFKYYIKKELEMIDLGLITYFFDIEVIQNNEGIFIS